MIFKAIRYLIYSSLQLVIDDIHLYDVDTHDQAIDIYNNYEVIGIRSEYYDHEEYVVISLKPTISKTRPISKLKTPLMTQIPTPERQISFGKDEVLN